MEQEAHVLRGGLFGTLAVLIGLSLLPWGPDHGSAAQRHQTLDLRPAPRSAVTTDAPLDTRCECPKACIEAECSGVGHLRGRTLFPTSAFLGTVSFARCRACAFDATLLAAESPAEAPVLARGLPCRSQRPTPQCSASQRSLVATVRRCALRDVAMPPHFRLHRDPDSGRVLACEGNAGTATTQPCTSDEQTASYRDIVDLLRRQRPAADDAPLKRTLFMDAGSVRPDLIPRLARFPGYATVAWAATPTRRGLAHMTACANGLTGRSVVKALPSAARSLVLQPAGRVYTFDTHVLRVGIDSLPAAAAAVLVESVQTTLKAAAPELVLTERVGGTPSHTVADDDTARSLYAALYASGYTAVGVGRCGRFATAADLDAATAPGLALFWLPAASAEAARLPCREPCVEVTCPDESDGGAETTVAPCEAEHGAVCSLGKCSWQGAKRAPCSGTATEAAQLPRCLLPRRPVARFTLRRGTAGVTAACVASGGHCEAVAIAAGAHQHVSELAAVLGNLRPAEESGGNHTGPSVSVRAAQRAAMPLPPTVFLERKAAVLAVGARHGAVAVHAAASTHHAVFVAEPVPAAAHLLHLTACLSGPALRRLSVLPFGVGEFDEPCGVAPHGEIAVAHTDVICPFPAPSHAGDAALQAPTTTGGGHREVAHHHVLQFVSLDTVRRETTALRPHDRPVVLYLGRDVDAAAVIRGGPRWLAATTRPAVVLVVSDTRAAADEAADLLLEAGYASPLGSERRGEGGRVRLFFGPGVDLPAYATDSPV